MNMVEHKYKYLLTYFKTLLNTPPHPPLHTLPFLAYTYKLKELIENPLKI